MRKMWGALAVMGLLVVGACSNTAKPAATYDPMKGLGTYSYSAPTSAFQLDESWVPSGYTRYDDEVAYRWSKDTVDCDKYQDSCFAIKVAAHYGCPDGVYIELSVLKDDTVVGRTNEITGGLRAGETAAAALEMPGGNPNNAKARLADLNCMGS